MTAAAIIFSKNKACKRVFCLDKLIVRFRRWRVLKMPAKKQAKLLTGKALLAKLDSMEGAAKKQIAKACGYVTLTKTGQERVNLMQFYNAILAAKDVDLDANQTGGASGRTPTYRVSVHKNGNILIGAAYTKEMGLEPGDEFEIKLKNHNIRLVRLEEE
ncbi:MAG: AbrB family transcriptional regulator [Synechococcus sp.]